MNRSFRTIATAVVAVVLASTGSASAQTVANGPYYATPSWDQTLPAATRFLVLANMSGEAVLDRETGLVWQRSPTSLAVYFDALRHCTELRTGGRHGWRLPTVAELTSLFDPSVPTFPLLPIGHPFTGFDISTPSFWSSTPAGIDAHFAAVPIGRLRVLVLADGQEINALCVRGAGP